MEVNIPNPSTNNNNNNNILPRLPRTKGLEVLLHILGLQLMVLESWVVIVEPDTGHATLVSAFAVLESVCLRVIEDFRHEAPGVVNDSFHLTKVSFMIQCSRVCY